MTERLDSQSPADKEREAFDALLGALKRAREGLYNGFEPDNQSRLYRDVDDAIKAGGQARALFTRSAGTRIPAPSGAYVPLTREQIEKIRGQWPDDLYPSTTEFNTLCDMAINGLLFSQDIDRLRATRSARTESTEGPLAWLVFCENDPSGFDYMVFASETEADSFACGKDIDASEIVPLFRRDNTTDSVPDRKGVKHG